MALDNFYLQYGILFAQEADYLAAFAANGNSIILSGTPEASLALYPAGVPVQFPGPFYFTNVPGTVKLGTYTPVFGSPGIVYSPNTVSTGTLSTTITVTAYGSFSNVIETSTQAFIWTGVLMSPGLITTPLPVPFTGTWQQQVVTYTGDGTANRGVATSFDLTKGVVAIYVFGGATMSAGPVYRHTGMTGSIGACSPIDTVGGITGFVNPAGGFGFGVTNDLGQLAEVNTLSHQYTAVIFSDTTSDNRYMQVGTYAGAGVLRTIPASGTLLNGKQLTQLWIFGRSGTAAFCSSDFPARQSLSWAAEAKSLTNQITALGVGTFSVGTDNNVNDATLVYYYAAFAIPPATPAADPIVNLFQTFTGTGTGADLVIALNFSPTFAIAANYLAGGPSTAWRGPFQAGTQSVSYGGTNLASLGIDALGVNSVTIGANTGPGGEPIYGFALVSPGATTPIIPVNVPVSPNLPPPNFPPGVVIPFVIGGGYSTQWLMEQFELKQRNEEHL